MPLREKERRLTEIDALESRSDSSPAYSVVALSARTASKSLHAHGFNFKTGKERGDELSGRERGGGLTRKCTVRGGTQAPGLHHEKSFGVIDDDR